MANSWFRMYANFLSNYNIQMMSEAYQRRLLMLLCLRAQDKSKSYSDDELAWLIRIGVNDARETKLIFIERNFIDEDWHIIDESLIWQQDRPPIHEWEKIRKRIFERDNYTCNYCGQYGKKLECDHIHPVSKGGLHNDENLVTACFKCNRSKNSKTLEEWMAENG